MRQDSLNRSTPVVKSMRLGMLHLMLPWVFG